MNSDQPATWTIRWHRSARDLSADLWAKTFAPPVEGLWWYLALEDSGLEKQFDFHYALLEKDGQPAGIAPAFVFDVPIDLVAPPLIARVLRQVGRVISRVRYQRTLFIGSPCADEGSIGVLDPADLPAAFLALQRSLDAKGRQVKAPMLVWKDFPSECEPALRPLREAKELFRVVSYPGTRAYLPGPDFAAYLRTLSSNHRHQFKKKLTRSRAMGPLETSVVRDPDAATQQEIFELFWQTYLKGKTKFEVLNPRFFQEIARYEGSHFVLIRDPATQKLVAFMLCFHIGPRVINKFIGIDYSYGGNWYLYFRLLEAAMEWASHLGVKDFQSGQTGYRAKTETGHQLVPLVNFCRHRNPLMNLVFSRVARGISWATLDEDLKTWLAAHPESVERSR